MHSALLFSARSCPYDFVTCKNKNHTKYQNNPILYWSVIWFINISNKHLHDCLKSFNTTDSDVVPTQIKASFHNAQVVVQ